MSDPLVCAIDVGTSAVRASVIRSDGETSRTVRRPRAAGEGSDEFDPDALWEDLAGALRDLHLSDVRLDALVIAGHIGAVMLGDDGAPLVRGLGWANRLGVKTLASVWHDPATNLRVAGRPAITGGAIPFLAWLREHRPDVHRRVRWVLSPKDDLIRRLSGVIATDHTSAAYTLGSDIRAREWAPSLIEAAGISVDQLPQQHESTAIVATVGDAAARQTGLPPGLPIVAGGPDGTVGAGAVAGASTDVIVDVAGTTDVLTRILSDADDPAASGTVTNPYVVGGLWSCGGPTGLTGGATAHWLRLLKAGQVGSLDPALEREIEQIPPGCEGLAISPLLTGSRFPDWQSLERGAVWGMAEAHTTAHFVRATHEAAAYVVRSGLEMLARDKPTAPVVLAGGTARSANLAQLRADVLRRTVSACVDPDVTIRGAAMLACVGMGIHAGLDAARAQMAPQSKDFEPDGARAVEYDRLYRDWLATRRALANKEHVPT